MKTVDIQETNLDACVIDAQSDRVVIMRGGNPVAIVVGVQGLDEEQAQLVRAKSIPGTQYLIQVSFFSVGSFGVVHRCGLSDQLRLPIAYRITAPGQSPAMHR